MPRQTAYDLRKPDPKARWAVRRHSLTVGDRTYAAGEIVPFDAIPLRRRRLLVQQRLLVPAPAAVPEVTPAAAPAPAAAQPPAGDRKTTPRPPPAKARV